MGSFGFLICCYDDVMILFERASHAHTDKINRSNERPNFFFHYSVTSTMPSESTYQSLYTGTKSFYRNIKETLKGGGGVGSKSGEELDQHLQKISDRLLQVYEEKSKLEDTNNKNKESMNKMDAEIASLKEMMERFRKDIEGIGIINKNLSTFNENINFVDRKNLNEFFELFSTNQLNKNPIKIPKELLVPKK
jgi:predicted nuclease with TOPRIM domain